MNECALTTPSTLPGTPAGLQRQRQPCAHVARVCMLDKASSRFIGNVWTIPAAEVKNSDATWAFNAAVCLESHLCPPPSRPPPRLLQCSKRTNALRCHMVAYPLRLCIMPPVSVISDGLIEYGTTLCVYMASETP
jgi:hypothetical protein